MLEELPMETRVVPVQLIRDLRVPLIIQGQRIQIVGLILADKILIRTTVGQATAREHAATHLLLQAEGVHQVEVLR